MPNIGLLRSTMILKAETTQDTTVLLDILLLKFLIFISRFRRSLGPSIERWIQDDVWQLQQRAYEGEGVREWVDREDEIPRTKEKLACLRVMWVPGKSPVVGVGVGVLGV